MEPIKNRYEFVFLFDVENGNPNGDPDAGNLPRTDPETGLGIVTDVCLKRKIRNYVELVKEGEPGYDIFIKMDRSLNEKIEEASKKTNSKKPGKSSGNANQRDEKVSVRDYMCENYFDVRAFGAVLSTNKKVPSENARGSVQLTMARSVDPVFPQEMTITRQAITNDEKFDAGQNSKFGKKSFVPYALYRAEGYVSALQAQKITKLSEEDLDLLWEAIINMFEHDHSAARGKVCVRKLYVFKHATALGNAPSVELFDKIVVAKKDGVEYPRSFRDYEISVESEMPEGVELIEKL